MSKEIKVKSSIVEGRAYQSLPEIKVSTVEIPLPLNDTDVVLTTPGGQDIVIKFMIKDQVLCICLPEKFKVESYNLDVKSIKLSEIAKTRGNKRSHMLGIHLPAKYIKTLKPLKVKVQVN